MSSQTDIRAEAVSLLSLRVAQATHALLLANESTPVPTAAEVCVYDSTALSAQATGAALREASKHGLCYRTNGGFWCPGNLAYELRGALEDRVLADEDNPEGT